MKTQDGLLDFYEYEGNSKLLGINSNCHLYRSTFLQNPIVIMDNTRRLSGDRFLNPLYISAEILYSISNDELNSFVSDNNMGNEIVKVTNAKDQYYFNRKGIERNVKLISAISVFIMVLELLTIVFTIKMEYTMNGVEIAIKKTLGYSVLESTRRIVLMPFILIPGCTMVATILVSMYSYGHYPYVILCGVALLIVEMALIINQCRQLNKAKIALILKGAKI